jgi:rRNA processing protein Krr1/Pno1
MSNPNLPLGIALVCGAAACALTLAVSDVGAGGGVALGAVVAGAALIFQGQKPAEEKEVSQSKAPKKPKKPVAHTNSTQATPSSPVEEKKPKKKSKKSEKSEASPKAAAPKATPPKSAPKSPPTPAPAPQQKPKIPQPQSQPPKPSSDTENKELTKTQLQKLKKKQKKESEEKAKAEEKALEAKREAAQAKKAAKAASKKKEPVTPQTPQGQSAIAYSSGEDTKEDEDGWEKPKPRNTIRIRSPQDSKKRKEEKEAKAREAKSPTAEGPKVVVEVRVPKAKHGLIIGKGGTTLDLIQKETKAKVTMPKREGGGLGVVISGTAEQVKEAEQIVRDLAIKGYSQLTHPNFQSGEIILENSDQVGRIAGPGGVFLKAIQKNSGATLQLPEKDAAKAVINISGKLEQITNAKLAIMSLLDQGYSEYTHPGWVTEEYDFQPEYLGRLIGPGGSKIKELQQTYNVKIDTPKREDVKQDIIVIKGKPSSIEEAKEAIAELTVNQEPAPEELPVPAADDPWNQEIQEPEW